MKLFRVFCLALLAAIILAVAPITTVAFADGDSQPDDSEESPKYMYSYEEEIVPIGGGWDYSIHKLYVEGYFGTLTKKFRVPASYEVGVQLDSPEMIAAIKQIIDEEKYFRFWNSDGELRVAASMTVDNLELDFEQIGGDTIMRHDLTDGFDFNGRTGTITQSANDEYTIDGYACVTVSDPAGVVRIYFPLEPEEITPIEDGSLIYFQTDYYHGGATRQEVVTMMTHGEIFSTDEYASCYVVKELDASGRPASEFTFTYIYNGKTAIEQQEYSVEMQVSEASHTIQGKLDFQTQDGATHTLYTNVITVKNHHIEMRIDGTDDYRVGAGIEHEYSFIFDDNDYPDVRIESFDVVFDRYMTVAESGGNLVGGATVKLGEFNQTTFNLVLPDVAEVRVRLNIDLSYNNGTELVEMSDVRFDILVSEEEPPVVRPEYQISFDIPENAAAIFGGNAFELSASINEVFGDEHFDLLISVVGSALEIVSGTGGSVLLVPLSVGRSLITCTATSSTAGVFSRSIFIDVVESTSENTSITFAEDFILTGSSIVGYLSIGGYTNFLNATHSWRVQIEDGEELVDVPVIVNEYGAAIINNASKGYYHFSVSGDNVVAVEAVQRVANINMAEVARKYLPFLAPIMVLCVVVVLFLRKRTRKKHTIDSRLKKISADITAYSNERTDSAAFRSQLRKISHGLRTCLSLASTKDQETLGQYQNICSILNNSVKICEAAGKNLNKFNKSKVEEFWRCMREQYVEEAARRSAELDDALVKYATTKTVAVTVAPAEKKKTKKEDYLVMLTKFYRQGDDEDDNGRSGDSDRDADTRTEN